VNRPFVAPHTPSDADAAPDRGVRPLTAASLALRLPEPVDAELLREQIAALWPRGGTRGTRSRRIELSVVETCGRTPDEREHDALRLLRAEADTPGPMGLLRATLVRLSASEHLLLLTAVATPSDGLIALASELGRLRTVSALVLGG
jgi:hypothetical protein